MADDQAKQIFSQCLMGYWVSQGVFVAAKLKVADHLAAGAMSAEELAQRIDCNAGALYRVLRALAGVGIFTEDNERRFSLTPAAEYLRTDAPDSQWATTMLQAEVQYAVWGGLFDAVKTGEGAFEKVNGKPFFEWLNDNPKKADIFDATMAGWMLEEGRAAVEAYDWPDPGEVVDVGGGAGGLLLTLLDKHPGIHGVVFDQPEVIERTRITRKDDPLMQRCRLEGGDFFKAVPPDADIYMLRNIIHDWDDERSIQILKTCRAACGADGKILLVESVIQAGNEPSFGKWLDLNMLILLSGKERTEAEYRELLTASGLQLERVIPTRAEMSILETRPA